MWQSVLAVCLMLFAATAHFSEARSQTYRTFPDTVYVTDEDLAAGQNYLWTSDKLHVLEGFVYVDSLSTLTIEPGTVVQARPGTGVNASALIVTRGARLVADGTAEEPIIFTVLGDTIGIIDDIPLDARGLWGGLVILGRAVTNYPGSEYIEGLPKNSRALFGGDDDDDDSGVLRYVSLRYGGSNLGSETGNEINGISFGGVGRGTIVEHVEVFGNDDDGLEMWGGTVDLKYIVAAFNGDDSFDYDAGWRGRGQFWLSVQAADVGDNAGEHDGGDGIVDAEPFSLPVIYNVTYIGSGEDSDNADNKRAIHMRDNAGGKYFNSVITDFYGFGLRIEDVADPATEDSRKRLETGDIEFAGNFWYGFGDGNTPEAIFPQEFIRNDTDFLTRNYIEDPQLRGISRSPDGGLDPRPAPESPLWDATRLAAYPDDPWYTPVNYAGAFGNVNWASWTFLAEAGFLSNEPSSIKTRSSAQPVALDLFQNAPNPFNPATVMTFVVPSSGHVRLSVYNVAGQHVASVLDGHYEAGTHSVTFNAEGLASGLYIYRLQAGQQSVTRKMTLVR